jgi:hypothetical protein
MQVQRTHDANAGLAGDVERRTWPRHTTLLGVVLVALWANKFVASLGEGAGWNILWLCHVGTLVLAVAAFTRQRDLVGIATLWIAAGLPVWLADSIFVRATSVASTLSHLGSFAIGLVLVRAVGLSRVAWVGATLGYVVLQLVCRFVTPRELNVNLAHAPYTGWEQVFPGYAAYNVFTTASLALGFAVIQWLLRRLARSMPQLVERSE